MTTVKFSELKSIPNTKREIIQYGNTEVSLFLEYYSLRYKKYHDRFIVDSRLLWQMYQTQNKIRILLVEMGDGDLVYCYLKSVTIYPAFYIILMGKPASKNGILQNEEMVLLELCQCGHVIGFEGIGEEIETVKPDLFDIKPCHYEEYYIDTQERFDNYLNHSKWKTKYFINKLKTNKDFVFRPFEHKDYLKNKKLVDQWKSVSDNGKKGIQFGDKCYNDILNCVYDETHLNEYLIYNLLYKNELLGCIMFLIIKVGDIKVSYQEHNINLSRCLEQENVLNLETNLYRNIGNIMFYLTTEDLIKRGVRYSYAQGVRFWKKKKSGEYKQRLNNRTIEFSKVFFRKQK